MSIHADRDGSEAPKHERNYGDALASFITQTKRVAKAERELAEERAVNGRLVAALIDEMVAHWHGVDDPTEEPTEPIHGDLHQYLGMTWKQYGAWVEDPSKWVAAHGAAWFRERFPDAG